MERPSSQPGTTSGCALRIGPAGWSYEDWVGRVYPPAPPRGFDRLGWIARFFDVVEVNASFYRIPSPRTAQGWIARVARRPGFRFTAKLHQSLTHERVADAAIVHQMLEFVRPLEEAGALGPLLAQFPWSLRPDATAFDYLRRLRDAFGERRLALEVRHGDWQDAQAQSAVATLGYDLVSVDQPQIGRSLPPDVQRTGETGYVRLHGRNRAAWFARDAGRDARYDYLYSPDELQEWTTRIVSLAASTRETYVITNNHFEGKAVANALELQGLLGLPVPQAPRWILEHYPAVRATLARHGAQPQPVEATDVPAPDRSHDEAPSGQGQLFG